MQTRLEAVADVLRKHGVEFIVIGGQAANLHGSPRPTFDVDVCYRRTPENIRKLAVALREIKPVLRGAPAGLPFILDARSIEMGSNFTFTTAIGDLDILGHVEPLGGYEEIAKSAETYDLGPEHVLVISLDDLIRIKRHIGRSKDLDALAQLEAIRRIRDESRRGEAET